MDPFGITRSVVISTWLVVSQAACTAQWTTGPKAPCAERLYFKLRADTVLVSKDLSDTNRKGKAHGAVHSMGWWASPSGLYPSGRPLRPTKRLTTTDTAYRKGSTHLLSGVYRSHWRNGNLRQELVFNNGYILSDKSYYKNGNLLLWLDYDIELDGCLFSYYGQHCLTQEDEPPVSEFIDTFIDQHPGWRHPSYAWKAKRHGWKLACEIWAEPIRFMQLDSSTVRARYADRAVDGLLMRPGRSAIPAYVAVNLPQEECAGHRYRRSELDMTITHADGRQVGKVPMLPLIKPSPENGFRTRKALLGPQFYFPLGTNTGGGFQAYDLNPGPYVINFFSNANGRRELIGTAPLEVYSYW